VSSPWFQGENGEVFTQLALWDLDRENFLQNFMFRKIENRNIKIANALKRAQ
jgi:hypothetical protein